MTAAWRPTGGLSALDDLAPADHVCWAVAASDDYDGVARACLVEGCRAGDKVFYFGPEPSLNTAPLPDGSVAAMDPGAAFLAGGPLDADAMLAMFRREAATAQHEGFRALRVVADMDWVAGLATTADITSFELRLDAAVHEIGAIVVCAYRERTYAAGDVAQVATVHPLHFGAVEGDVGFRVWSGGARCWEVAGEVDCLNAEAFGSALAAVVADGPVRLRLDELAFIDVAGMRAIAQAARSGDGVRIVLEATSETFVRCWALLGYNALAPTVELVR